MDKNLKVFLWIVLSLIIIFIIYQVVKLIILYFTLKNSLNAAWFNTNFCGKKRCLPSDKQLEQYLPTSISLDYPSLEVAKYCTVVVYSLEKAALENTKPVYPSDLVVQTEVYDNDEDPIYGAVFTEKSNSNTIWIAYRGTLSSSEWAQDLAYKQGDLFSSKANVKQTKLTFLHTINNNNSTPSVHQGFVQAYENFREDILNTLSNLDPDKKKTIIVTGHSLGAAIATLTGIDLVQNSYSNVVVYNFASPRIGDQVFVDFVDNQIKLPLYRFVNMSDMIPNLPPSVSPNMVDTSKPYIYMHCGTLIEFQINRLSMLNNHLIPVYMQGLEELSDQNK